VTGDKPRRIKTLEFGDADAPRPARERILNAAFATFTERGYGGSSTLEIATRAKVSKRELYALFGDKRAMVIACIAGPRICPTPAIALPSPLCWPPSAPTCCTS
jgi:hypothetical protein